MNLYIESIEGGTFVAGTGDDSANNMLRDKYTKTLSFKSIRDIKAQVSGQKFHKVWLKQSTPYDEMCGSPESDQKLLLELDWE